MPNRSECGNEKGKLYQNHREMAGKMFQFPYNRKSELAKGINFHIENRGLWCAQVENEDMLRKHVL